jgi:plasmid replication initiation protein
MDTIVGCLFLVLLMSLDAQLESIKRSFEAKSKNANLETTGRDIAENSVTKSNALARAYYRLGLVEKRCMEALISKLNPLRFDVPYQDIELSAIEYAKAYGISEKNAYRHLSGAGDALINRVITVDGSMAGVDREKLTLMNRVQYLSDKGLIICTFNNLIVPHLLQIRGQFTKYPLRDAVDFSSSYTWRFYEILTSWAKPKTQTNGRFVGWIKGQSVEELREMLGVPASYSWQKFNTRVLEVAQAELRKKVNIQVKIKIGKTGRKITSLDIDFIDDDQQKLPLGGEGS